MINRGGENVYSIEVENALAGAPGVGEAAVVAVPDEMMGEKVGAVIVPAAGAELDVERRDRPLPRAASPTSRCPSTSPSRDEPLPRNPGGKLLKKQLREETEWGAAAALSGRGARTAEIDRGGSRWPRYRPCRAPSTRGELGIVLAHEHVRFRDEAVAEQWPEPLRRAARARRGAGGRRRREEHGVSRRSSIRPRCSAGATCAS